jgi:hypothetical protein
MTKPRLIECELHSATTAGPASCITSRTFAGVFASQSPSSSMFGADLAGSLGTISNSGVMAETEPNEGTCSVARSPKIRKPHSCAPHSLDFECHPRLTGPLHK